MSDFLSDYDYTLPDELIARHPPARREAARLMVVDRATGSIEHASIGDLPQILRPHDRLVLNNTRVLPARLLGSRVSTGGQWEGLYLCSSPAGEWQLLCQTRGKLRPGERIAVHPAHNPTSDVRLILTLKEKDDAEGLWTAVAEVTRDPIAALEKFGTVPLPPYMHRDLAEDDDFSRYQTTFAQHPGSVAAPTAGLHFTPELLAACEANGISHSFVTLHVGIGTFRPISVKHLQDHRMHAEWCELPETAATELSRCRREGGRVVAVGTTSTRTLESATSDGEIRPWRGSTDLFIRPPYRFQAVDCLLTNFHLPRSSLLVLVSAFAGRDLMLHAYQTAIEHRYRFYSYGDAMLLV